MHEEHLSQIALIYYSYNKPWPLRVKEALQKDNKENDMKIQHPSSIGLFEINVKHCKVLKSYSYTVTNKNLNIAVLEPYDYAAMKLNRFLQYIRV